jgi:hypothetical protein
MTNANERQPRPMRRFRTRERPLWRNEARARRTNMRLSFTQMAAVIGALAATACGDAMMSRTSDASTMQAYQAVGQDVSGAIASYAADTASMADDVACEATHAEYAEQMGLMLERMREMSTEMDRHMGDYGHTIPADLACVAEAMAAEFERHHAAACEAAEISADLTEAARHVGSMKSLVEHQRLRYEGAGTMMGMMSAPVATTWTCAKNADGTFTINGQPWTPGTPIPLADTEGTQSDPQPWSPCDGEACSGCTDSGGMGATHM